MHLDYRQELDEELARRPLTPRPLTPKLPITLPAGRETVWIGRSSTHIPWIGMLVSGGLHALLLFGLPVKPAPASKPLVPDTIEVQLPDLPDLEEDKPEVVENDSTDVQDLAASLVPSLADIPTTVPIDAFVQNVNPADMLPRKPDLSNATISIPAAYRKGPSVSTSGLKNVFDLAELDRKPEPITQVAPIYPPAMKRLGLPKVNVVARFMVTAQGEAVDIHVVKASYDGFEEATINAISRWKFRPGMKKGKAVNTRNVEQPLVFTVND